MPRPRWWRRASPSACSAPGRTGGRRARCSPTRGPRRRRALPLAQSAPGGAPIARHGQGSELDGERAWRRGDGLRQGVGRKAARRGQLVSRETTAESSRELWLDWQAAHAAGGAEARLSRLTAWVLAAERQGLAYGLRLPGQQFAPDRGEAHQRRLLRELALWH